MEQEKINLALEVFISNSNQIPERIINDYITKIVNRLNVATDFNWDKESSSYSYMRSAATDLFEKGRIGRTLMEEVYYLKGLKPSVLEIVEEVSKKDFGGTIAIDRIVLWITETTEDEYGNKITSSNHF